MSGTINTLYDPSASIGSSIYGDMPSPVPQAQQPQNALMPNAQGNDPMAQYMQWLMAPQGQQQQPGPAPMMPVGIPLPQYAPTPPGMAPTGPVATGSTADPYGINAWALQQAIGQQGGWGGGAGGGSSGGSAGNMSGAAAAAQGADLMSGGIY
jgi:hypothetical protein